MTSELLDLPEDRKARGAYFTPPEVSDFAVRWAIHSAEDDVLEPSCGEAVFLLSAAQRLRQLGATEPRLHGYELHAPSAERAKTLLRRSGAAEVEIRVGDFLAQPAHARYAAVIGNPPYVRYQGFTGTARQAGQTAALAQGVRLTNLASSWAPFVVHSAAFVRPDGRMALVLPAELLSSNYAADVREFLLRRFARLKVVLFDGLVFPGVQTEAVLLLAEGSGGTSEVEFGSVQTSAGLHDLRFETVLRPQNPSAKWTTAFVNTAAASTLASLTDTGQFTRLETWGRISLGAVTGANPYFAMSPKKAQRLYLEPSDLVRISPPGSTHLRNLTLSKNAYLALGEADASTLLFRPEQPSKAALAYIAQGERDGVQEAYKCRIRDPWWRVPLLAAPDLFFTYMNGETAQLCSNPYRLRHLNSVHGLYVDPAHRDQSSLLALSALNSATMLSAETVGRAYGGGILKMEPREAAQLAVPSPQAVAAGAGQLRAIGPKVRAALRSGDLAAAVAIVDSVVLVSMLGLPEERVHDVRRGRNLLAHRRRNRTRAVAAR